MEPMKSRRRLWAWGLALLVAVLTFVPRPAYAGNDILVGMFYTSDSNHTNSVYVSYDGKKMTRVSSFYGSTYRDGNGNSHAGHVDPSIMYYKGKFWALSGWNRYDGKFWPMISYSTDLVHWTHPEGEGLISGTHGISLSTYPSGFSRTNKGFDTVAPEWFVSKNGSVYIIFSAGYYGAFHGEPTKDRMQAYIVKVTKLSASDGVTDGTKKYLWPQNLTFKAGKAKRINIAGNSAKKADFIDGAGFVAGNKDYLIIKKNGLTNEIYKTSNIDKNKWVRVNSKALFGYEGASVAKLGNTYYMAADHVTGATADGVKMFKSTSLTKKNWGKAGTKFVTTSGKACKVRHGTIITLKAGTPGWQAAAKLLKTKLSVATVSGIANMTYTGNALTPTPTVKVRGTTLKLGTDYTLVYANNVEVGTATITIKGKGGYTGSKKVTFQIVPSATSANAKRTMGKGVSQISLVNQSKVYTGKAQAYTGEVTSSGSTGNVTFAYYSDSACTSPVALADIKDAGVYYVKATLAADRTHNAATSAVATFTITPAAISGTTVAQIENQEYTGKALSPDVVVSFNGMTLVRGRDFETEYLHNTEVGTATIVVSGKGNYTGTVVATFQITEPTTDITPDETDEIELAADSESEPESETDASVELGDPDGLDDVDKSGDGDEVSVDAIQDNSNESDGSDGGLILQEDSDMQPAPFE